MLSIDEIARMKTVQEDHLPDLVSVLRSKRISDGAGGWNEAWGTASTVSGRIAPADWRPQEPNLAGRLTATQRYVITLPVGTDVVETDRLQIAGRQFGIISVQRRSQATALRLICEEVL